LVRGGRVDLASHDSVNGAPSFSVSGFSRAKRSAHACRGGVEAEHAKRLSFPRKS
jgi:hypothetical protein